MKNQELDSYLVYIEQKAQELKSPKERIFFLLSEGMFLLESASSARSKQFKTFVTLLSDSFDNILVEWEEIR